MIRTITLQMLSVKRGTGGKREGGLGTYGKFIQYLERKKITIYTYLSEIKGLNWKNKFN